MDDSSTDDDLQIQAFAVEDKNDSLFDLNIPPTSGNEYLRRVREEAKVCPQIVVSDIDPKTFQKKQTVKISEHSGHSPAPRGYTPNIKWQKQQAADFAVLRQNFQRQKVLMAKRDLLKRQKLPQCNDVEGWCRLCFGRLQPPGVTAEEVRSEVTMEGQDINRTTHEGVLPLLSIVAALDQPTIERLLEYHINWFEATGFTEKQGQWFYALLCCLEKPLSPESCSLIRSLARSCANLRATLDSPEDPRLVPLNLFICLVSRYFDQSDLVDGVR
ncbi:hypothetical protein FSP39_023393 [Pinctada imbricata]|uniref:Gem-associated protein 2 n=1 Tax=Pinctada imbricata TaxID=66713 RepID=A0AA88YW27_PINIB|nr:hypothetical protein FSP39_023393 [Pinctada imbricata]